MLSELRRVADFIASSPIIREQLGGNFDASVQATPTGGVVFVFEPESSP
jgi:hypothetical protein